MTITEGNRSDAVNLPETHPQRKTHKSITKRGKFAVCSFLFFFFPSRIDDVHDQERRASNYIKRKRKKKVLDTFIKFHFIVLEQNSVAREKKRYEEENIKDKFKWMTGRPMGFTGYKKLWISCHMYIR